ncbi:hypothetical protein [uncultured Cardiobacterium sp.]|uniref:hypothetical protein n=1 Tax=uncultured Cardiobacterium sp. TaxID=417619 RepID=UPI00260420BC|nr:hypothetical protein [uncultured Cardiobacterium sp.]
MASPVLDIGAINQSAGAKRTLAGIAKRSRLDAAWVHTLFSLHWNYDKRGREAMGWVTPAPNAALDSAYERLAQGMNLPATGMTAADAARAALHVLENTDPAPLAPRLAAAAARGDMGVVAEVAACFYFQNATAAALTAAREEKPLDRRKMLWHQFRKLHSPFYPEAYSFLVLRLPCREEEGAADDRLLAFADEVNRHRERYPGLGDLLKAVAPYCPGNRNCRRMVLIALSYAGLLHVPGHPVAGRYLPGHKDELSSHFMSNEWPYPLRFWRGG